MNEFFDWIVQNYQVVIAIVSALISAIAGMICMIKGRSFSLYLRRAKERETYTVCPHCKKAIPLSELTFHLPSGEVDNDLNGVPDHLQK